MDNPIYKWMINGGTLILGPPHIVSGCFTSGGATAEWSRWPWAAEPQITRVGGFHSHGATPSHPFIKYIKLYKWDFPWFPSSTIHFWSTPIYGNIHTYHTWAIFGSSKDLEYSLTRCFSIPFTSWEIQMIAEYSVPSSMFLVGRIILEPNWLVVFGTSILFSQKYWVSNIIPIDVHIFQRGGPTTNQLSSSSHDSRVDLDIWGWGPGNCGGHLCRLPQPKAPTSKQQKGWIRCHGTYCKWSFGIIGISAACMYIYIFIYLSIYLLFLILYIYIVLFPQQTKVELPINFIGLIKCLLALDIDFFRCSMAFLKQSKSINGYCWNASAFLHVFISISIRRSPRVDAIRPLLVCVGVEDTSEQHIRKWCGSW